MEEKWRIWRRIITASILLFCVIISFAVFMLLNRNLTVSRNAGYVEDAAKQTAKRIEDLLIAADCTAYAYAGFHQDFIRGRIVLVGCPKLDEVDYSEKLTEIIAQNDIKSVTVLRMEVPCCAGIEYAAMTALQNSNKFIPYQVINVSTKGTILNQRK